MNRHVFNPRLSPANEGVWAFVCGYAPKLRRQKYKIMVLRAYIDDSMESGDALIMAGYISTAEKWASFSYEWAEILGMKRPYALKSYHASKTGQSEEEQERSMFLYRVIERHVIAGICCCIRIAPLVEWCAKYNLASEYSNPYLLAIKGVVNLVAQDQQKIGIGKPIDFVFDERGEKKHLVDGWELYKNSIPEDVLSVTGTMPVFQNDEKVLPLQAADMIAWHMLQLYRQERSILKPHYPFPWDGKVNYPVFRYEPSDRDLKRNLWNLKKNLSGLNPRALRWLP